MTLIRLQLSRPEDKPSQCGAPSSPSSSSSSSSSSLPAAAAEKNNQQINSHVLATVRKHKKQQKQVLNENPNRNNEIKTNTKH